MIKGSCMKVTTSLCFLASLTQGILDNVSLSWQQKHTENRKQLIHFLDEIRHRNNGNQWQPNVIQL